MYNEDNVPKQNGKTFFITGANTGIGFETARVLAGRKARVLLGCRSEVKASDAIGRIRSISSDADLMWVPLDLTSLESIRKAADIVQNEPRLDVLVNNAGVMIPPKETTKDGFELQFGVNHLGHFALTGMLLDKLKATDSARIVNVSSLAHKQGKIDFDDIHAQKSYDPMVRYRMSKLANMLFTFSLSSKLVNADCSVKVVACHPGVAETELGRFLPRWFAAVAPFIRPFFNTPAEGALPTLEATTSPQVKNCDYFGPTVRGETARGSGRAHIEDRAKNTETADRLWAVSESLTGVEYGL